MNTAYGPCSLSSLFGACGLVRALHRIDATDFARRDVWHTGGRCSLADAPTLAIVGSRAATVRGIARARRMSRLWRAAGGVVVSGGAKGIDAATVPMGQEDEAEGASRSILVPGCGFDYLYPPETRDLQLLVQKHGWAVSLWPDSGEPEGAKFVERNGLIAALSDVALIADAERSSGTVHVARAMIRLGRPLFASAWCVSVVRKWVADGEPIGDRVRVVERPSDILNLFPS